MPCITNLKTDKTGVFKALRKLSLQIYTTSYVKFDKLQSHTTWNKKEVYQR